MINMAKSDGVARILAMAAIGSGSGANVDYSNVKNKPQINGNELEGNKSAADLGLATSGVVSNVSYEASTGVLTFEKEDGTSFTIDLPLELLIESGEYNPDTQQIVLTLANKEVITIDVKDLISTYYGDDETIELFVEDEKQKFRIKQTIMDNIVEPIMFSRNDSSDALKEKAQKVYDYYKKNNKPYPNMYYRHDSGVDSYIYNFMGMDKERDTSYRLRFARPQDYYNTSDWWAWNTENIIFTVVNDVVNRADLSENGFNISRTYSKFSPGSLSSRNTNTYTPTSDYNPSTKLYTDQRVQSIAPNYDATSTYKVGDYVSYQGKFYKCTTAIETAEAWNSEHWSETTVKDEFGKDANIYLYYEDTKDEMKTKLTYIYNYYKKNKDIPTNVYFGFHTGDQNILPLVHIETDDINYATDFDFTALVENYSLGRLEYKGIRYHTWFNKEGIISGDIIKYTPTNPYIASAWNGLPGALLSNNTQAYTPTDDYNPATKKYVDDAVAGISTTPFYELEVVFDNGYKLTDASKSKVDSIFAHIKNKETFNAILYGNDVSSNRVMFPWSGNNGANAIHFEALDGATVGSHYFYDRYIIKPDYSVVIDQNIIPASIPGSLYLGIYDIDTDEEIIKKLKEAYKTISSNGNLVVMGSYYENVQTETDFIRNEYRLTNYNFEEKEMMWETLGKAELEFALYGKAIGGNIKTHIIRITYTNTNDVEKVEKENLDTYLPLTETGGTDGNAVYTYYASYSDDSWFTEEAVAAILQAVKDNGYSNFELCTLNGSHYTLIKGGNLQTLTTTDEAFELLSPQNNLENYTNYTFNAHLNENNKVVVSGLVKIVHTAEETLKKISGYDSTKEHLILQSNAGNIEWVSSLDGGTFSSNIN